MNTEDKISTYEHCIETIQSNPFDNVFVCLILQNYSNNPEKDFPEYFLFKDIDDVAWLSNQIYSSEVQQGEFDDNQSVSEHSHKLNKYRILMLLLCIEMIK